MTEIVFENLHKEYDNGYVAIENFDLKIEDGEFTVLVGPSGCGKSTLLRMIAGLEDITDGRLLMDGEVLNDVRPKDRDLAMVFQSYALYPHMTVFENMSFALENKKMAVDDIKKRVEHAANLLDLTAHLKKLPGDLSGGQRQRVALGRAIVREPALFLMDEPLSNLDAKLRVQTRSEIINLHKNLNNNFIYVTHDQTEALTMGDRIIVMNDGKVQQAGTPTEIYESPENIFVASFIGSPEMSFFKASIARKETSFLIKLKNDTGIHFKFELPLQEFSYLKEATNKDVILGIRPEDMTVCYPDSGDFNMVVTLIENLGSEQYFYNTDSANQICVYGDKNQSVKTNETIGVSIKKNAIHIFDQETGAAYR